jgi:hypothetical protein
MPEAEEPPQEENSKEKEKQKAAELAAKKKLARTLRLACYNGDVDAVKELIASKADPSLPDDGLGETALHYACIVATAPTCRQICEILVAAGVDMSVKNIREQAAWDKALPNGELEGNYELVYFLKGAHFKGLDSKGRTKLLEDTYLPYLDAEVAAMKASGEEALQSADKGVARGEPLSNWKTFAADKDFKAFVDALYIANGVPDHPFQSKSQVNDVTLDNLTEWFLEWGVEKKEEEAEGNEAPAEGEAPPAEA